MKRGAIPPVQEMQQWKKQQLEEEERNKSRTIEEKTDKTREFIAKNIGSSLGWSETELDEPETDDSAAHRMLLKEFASLGYQVWLKFSNGDATVPDFVFDWENLYHTTRSNDWFKVALPEKSAV